MTRRDVLVAGLPALLAGTAYFIFLGHRSDYLGHFAAGFGATLLALAATVEVVPEAWRGRLATAITMICIGLGAIAEATVFRIARFDEVDFFNQSLGAVLAGAAALNMRKPRLAGAMIGFIFLGAGFHFAFA